MRLRIQAAVSPLLLSTALTAGIAFGIAPNARAGEVPEDKVYSDHIQCEAEGDCRIDLYLTRGYRAFSQCQVCHGLTGDGSTIGPSLNKKMLEIDRERFDDVMENGFTGQIGVMPGWKDNPNIMNNIDALYAYLMARADGVIPSGRLERFDR